MSINFNKFDVINNYLGRGEGGGGVGDIEVYVFPIISISDY